MNRAQLRALPKAHLHVHLEGAIREATVAELASRQGRPPLKVDGYTDLAGFVAAYEGARDLVEDRDDLRRLASEVAEDALAEGFVWSEVHFSPGSYRGRLGSEAELVEIVLEGLRKPQRHGTGAALILGHNRSHDAATAERMVDLAVSFADRGVIGVGLVGDERYPGAPFADAFARARAAGLASLPHAGEVAGPERVREAIDVLGADRIGHGVRAIEDSGLVAELARRQICLDVCPTSNLRLTGATDRVAHPLARLVAAGVPVSLNSDDPTFFGQSALDEYVHAEAQGLDVVAVARSSLRHSRAPASVTRPAAEVLGDPPGASST